MNFDYTQFEGMAGGELAHRLPKEIRINMAAKGYSPLSYEDLAAFCTGKKPINSLFEAAGVGDKRFSKLGSSNSNDSKDWGAIFKEVGGGSPMDDYDAEYQKPVDPRESVREQMGSYGKSGGSNMDSRIQDLIGTKRTSQPAPSNLITDKKAAAKLGYANMTEVLKANRLMLETTNANTSNAMTKAAGKLTTGRTTVHPNFQKDYDYGVEYAKKNFKG